MTWSAFVRYAFYRKKKQTVNHNLSVIYDLDKTYILLNK